MDFFDAKTKPSRTNSMFAAGGYHYTPIMPVHVTSAGEPYAVPYANPSAFRADPGQYNIQFANGNPSYSIRKEFNKGIMNFRKRMSGNEAEHGAFIRFFNTMKSLNVTYDFWKHTCFCCDWLSGANREDREKLVRQMEQTSDFRTRLNIQKQLDAKMYSFSSRILSNDSASCVTRSCLQFTIFMLYTVLFVMLIVYYQDMAFCRLFKDNLKTNMTTSDDFAMKCEVLSKSDCILNVNGAKYNTYQYAQIRLTLFVLSCIPFAFLYCCLRSLTTRFMDQMNPENMDALTIKEVDGKSYQKLKNHWYTPSAQWVKRFYTILYLIVFFGCGIAGLVIDGFAVASWQNCHETKWSSLAHNARPVELPTALLCFNSVATIVGIFYFMSRFCRGLAKEAAGHQMDWSEIDGNAGGDAVTVGHVNTGLAHPTYAHAEGTPVMRAAA